ncbi:MAG: type II secretion system major pseudopilin GspG [Lentisphaeraceae bacterium]|nr:type II secretion system major pseudopilin GspG [Lentisphaeraceae bacterium]
MKKLNKRIKRRNFSLLEVIIAISILALVAALAVPNFLGQAEEAKANAAKVEMNTLKQSVTNFKLDTGKFPTSLEDLVSNSQGLKNWKQYLEDVPKDPWGNDYRFESRPELFNKFEIISYGSDGQPGGEGTNADITLSKSAN